MKLTKRKVCTFGIAALAAVAAVYYTIGGPGQDSYAAGIAACHAVDAGAQSQDCVPLDRSRLSIAALRGM